MDKRIEILASNLINYSIKLQKGEKILIHYTGSTAVNLIRALIKETYKVEGIPFVKYTDNKITRELLLGASQEQWNILLDNEMHEMKKMDAYLAIRAYDNVNEIADVPSKNILEYKTHYLSGITNERVDNTRWCVLRYPNDAMAQLANTSLESFEDFYFDVCNLDYSKMSNAMDNLVDLMEKTDRVRIVGKDTDLSFSIKNIPVIKCDGEMNIPDGEIFTAPVKNSVNGVLSYNTPAVYDGITFDNIKFEFENGKIIKASANFNEKINDILNTDEGARYIGEFAIGVNPYIINPMKDTLFDEKIMGSIHFTPGRAYEDANNGNKSSIHWDLVYIQTDKYGGGEIYFDDVLIRKNGMFVLDSLKSLNPENLK